jgi:hypothetical protein
LCTVWIKVGFCSCDSLLNLLLCSLGYIPGLLHAWYIIASTPDPYILLSEEDEADLESNNRVGARVTYYYVSSSPGQQGGVGGPQPQHLPPGAGMVVGAPDGGRAHRELERSGGSGYGTIPRQAGSRGTSPQPPPSGAQAGPARAPPSYDEAVQGDHKVQTP